MPRLYEDSGAVTAGGAPGRMKIKIISPGKGSSGDYPAKTIEEAVSGRLFKAGTHMHLDHPTPSERAERPGRSVSTLAAVLEEDAYLEGPDAVANIKVFSPYRALLSEMKDHIGVSIAAEGDVSPEGLVEAITSVRSIDFVTRAGRGGEILELLESASEAQLEEATNNDIRQYLEAELQTAYGTDEDVWVWLHDFDDDFGYFSISSRGEQGTEYRQSYTRSGVNVSLTGDRQEVKRETSYTPVGANLSESASNIPTDHLLQEDTMVDITEAEHTRLQEAATRATSLEEENAALKRGVAQAIVDGAFDAVNVEAPKGRARLVEDALQAEAFDPEAFRKTVEEALTEYAPRSPEVTGFGETAPPQETPSVGAPKPLNEDAILNALKGR